MPDIELSKYHADLPATLEDLSTFVLVGRERLAAVKAQIRAIEKLKLAQEVRAQKLEECNMLSEALLDAEIRIGDLLRKLPKGTGGNTRGRIVQVLIPIDPEQNKSEMIKKLGFNKDQAYRFETLAENKEVVEQIKAEAREHNRIASRSEILSRIKEEKRQVLQQKQELQMQKPQMRTPQMRELSKQEAQNQGVQTQELQTKGPQNQELQIKLEENARKLHQKFCAETYKAFANALSAVQELEVDDKHLNAFGECLRNQLFVEREQIRVKEALTKIKKIQSFLKELKK